MFQFFWQRNASVWTAVLYILLGLTMAIFPGVSGTIFVWLLAGAALVYAVIRFWQCGRAQYRTHQTDAGNLFLGVLALAFAVFCACWPQTVLSILPFLLGALLLVDGVGKIPLATAALRGNFPHRVPLLLSSLIPILLGILILTNPFRTARMVIAVFGISLFIDGASDLTTMWMERRR